MPLSILVVPQNSSYGTEISLKVKENQGN